MRFSTQLSMAIHILAFLAMHRDMEITSKDLAGSIGTNPVVVRRLMGKLKRGGFVYSRSGVAGLTLAKEPAHITLWEVFEAVEAKDSLFTIHPHPHPLCDVGGYITGVMAGYNEEALLKLRSYLQTVDLEQVITDLRQAKQRADKNKTCNELKE